MHLTTRIIFLSVRDVGVLTNRDAPLGRASVGSGSLGAGALGSHPTFLISANFDVGGWRGESWVPLAGPMFNTHYAIVYRGLRVCCGHLQSALIAAVVWKLSGVPLLAGTLKSNRLHWLRYGEVEMGTLYARSKHTKPQMVRLRWTVVANPGPSKR